MRRVIAFLGALRDDAKPVSYAYGDDIYIGTVFPEALCQFIEFDRMNVFVTEVARKTSYRHLERLNNPRIEAIDIPDGRTPEERWLIFAKLLSVVEDGDNLIFDITHAFRSIPFFVFLAIAFLKSARENVTIERILYGELGSDEKPGPIIDMTEYLQLLDWMSATDQFVEFGNSKAMVNLVKMAASSSGSPEDRQGLLRLATALDDVSRSLQLIIPHRAMSSANMLQKTLSEAREPIQRHIRPFVPLVNRVDSAFAAMALEEDPRDQSNISESLAREREIVHWYLDRQLLLQAISVAFEWLISYAVAHLSYETLYHGPTRTKVRKDYIDLSRGEAPSFHSEDKLRQIPHIHQFLDLFKRTTFVRNDLLHASKTVKTNFPPAQWEEKIRNVCKSLDDFPIPTDRKQTTS